MTPIAQILRPQEAVHQWVASCLKRGDHAIDATAGNGYDTLFLAECVGLSGCIHAFDIQEQALETTRRRMAEAGFSSCLQCHAISHSQMQHIVSTPTQAIIFNLGYLPGGDHSLTTKTSESLLAIESALSMLAKGGILAIMCYPGHEEGEKESAAVEQLLSSLPQSH